MTEKWLTIDQIAKYLQVSKEKIYKMCQQGRMPASKFGGQWRFKKEVVDRWLLGNQKRILSKATRKRAKVKIG